MAISNHEVVMGSARKGFPVGTGLARM